MNGKSRPTLSDKQKRKDHRSIVMAVLKSCKEMISYRCDLLVREFPVIDRDDAWQECMVAICERIHECPGERQARRAWVAHQVQNALRTWTRKCRRWGRERRTAGQGDEGNGNDEVTTKHTKHTKKRQERQRQSDERGTGTDLKD